MTDIFRACPEVRVLMDDRRRAYLSSRCAWCNKVWTGANWLRERRLGCTKPYTHGICLSCLHDNFDGGIAQDGRDVPVPRALAWTGRLDCFR